MGFQEGIHIRKRIYTINILDDFIEIGYDQNLKRFLI